MLKRQCWGQEVLLFSLQDPASQVFLFGGGEGPLAPFSRGQNAETGLTHNSASLVGERLQRSAGYPLQQMAKNSLQARNSCGRISPSGSRNARKLDLPIQFEIFS